MADKDCKRPRRLEWLRALGQRDGLSKELHEEWQRLELGEIGELRVLEEVERCGEDSWFVFQNVWLDYYGRFEVDLLLVTQTMIFVIECKHYSGSYTYANSQFQLHGKAIGSNPISQVQRATLNVKSLVEEVGLGIPVRGLLVFTGDYFDLQLMDAVADLEILRLGQLRHFLRKVRKPERKSRRTVNQQVFLQLLDRFRVSNPNQAEVLSAEMEASLKRGIRCVECGSFHIETRFEKVVRCVCGVVEPKENAIVRTICEYGVIYWERDLLISELVIFFAGTYSANTLQKYCRKHFIRVGRGRSSRYINNGLPFSELLSQLDLKEKYYQKNIPYNM